MAMGIPRQESELKAAAVATSLTKFDDVSELDLDFGADKNVTKMVPGSEVNLDLGSPSDSMVAGTEDVGSVYVPVVNATSLLAETGEKIRGRDVLAREGPEIDFIQDLNMWARDNSISIPTTRTARSRVVSSS